MKHLFSILLLLTLLGCEDAPTPSTTEFIPSAPDYKDSTMWYIQDNGKEVDVFYVLPTCIFDWKTMSSQQLCHYYDVEGKVMKENFDYSLQLAADIFGQDCNFYAPYYRQISLNSWLLADSIIEKRFAIAQQDVESAFRYFLEHQHPQKDFILAGYSQGAKAVVELVKSLKPEEMKRMKAAYAIGYRITSADLQNTNLRPAEDESGQGVTVCYNSVKTADDIWPAVSANNQVCINPVNWKTDATVAHLDSQITVQVDTLSHILLVKGYDNNGNSIPLLEGTLSKDNYHLSELTLYQKQLRENVKKRIEE